MRPGPSAFTSATASPWCRAAQRPRCFRPIGRSPSGRSKRQWSFRTPRSTSSKRCTRKLAFRDDLRPLGFIDYPNPELFGFLELRTCAGSGDDQVRLRANRACSAGAEALRLRLGFVAAHGFEAAGEDDGFAGPFGLLGVADEWLGRILRQQIVERFLVVRFMEEVDQRFRDHGADTLDRRQFRFAPFRKRRAAQFLDGPEAFEQVARGDDADVADAQAEEEARAVGIALGLDRSEEIVDRFLLPALAGEQFGPAAVQSEDIRGRMKPA